MPQLPPDPDHLDAVDLNLDLTPKPWSEISKPGTVSRAPGVPQDATGEPQFDGE